MQRNIYAIALVTLFSTTLYLNCSSVAAENGDWNLPSIGDVCDICECCDFFSNSTNIIDLSSVGISKRDNDERMIYQNFVEELPMGPETENQHNKFLNHPRSYVLDEQF